MGRAILVALGLLFAAGPVLGDDTVKMSCSEYARLTGKNLCDMFPEVKLTKADYDRLMRADEKKNCLAGHILAGCDTPSASNERIEEPLGALWK
jgi:hypothetical protein